MVEPALASGVGRLVAVDGLRFLAALGVVLFHFTNRENDAWGAPVGEVFPELAGVTVYGALGVPLFFMISGFVILMSVQGKTVSHFVGSRVARLFPAYWAAVLITGLYLLLRRDSPGVGSFDDFGFAGWVANLTMMQPAVGVAHVDGVYWTLWVELKFYVLLGLMLLVGITRNRIIALCVFWPLFAAVASRFDEPLLNQLLEPTYAPFFAIGMLVYLIWKEGASFLVVAILFMNWAFTIVSAYNFFGPQFLTSPSNPHVVAAIFTAFIVVLLAATVGPLSKAAWPWITVAGALTYPLYLLHEELGWGIISSFPQELPRYLVLVIAIVIVLAIAWLINRFVERPLAPLLRRAVARSLAPRPVLPPTAPDPVTPAR